MTVYYCVIGQMFHAVKYDELKASYVFNVTMATHYQQLYKKHCNSWNFTRAAYYFMRYKKYHRQSCAIECQLKLTPAQLN
jgi:hypothetical protein